MQLSGPPCVIRATMPFSFTADQKQIVALKLDGVITEADLAAFLQAIESALRTADPSVAFIVDMTSSDGGSNKHRKAVAETFGLRTKPWGRCVAMAVVTQTEGQDSFLRGILASGPIPFAYRFFQDLGEATVWVKSRLRGK